MATVQSKPAASKYTYFVAFNLMTTSGLIGGNATRSTSKPIDDIQQIRDIEEEVSLEYGASNCVRVISWQLLKIV
jgi:hypothetical protein